MHCLIHRILAPSTLMVAAATLAFQPPVRAQGGAADAPQRMLAGRTGTNALMDPPPAGLTNQNITPTSATTGRRGSGQGRRGNRGPQPTPAPLPPPAPDDSKPTLTPPAADFDTTHTGIAHGKSTALKYHSSYLNLDRDIVIYTPPNYSTSQKYPVLYLMHGQTDIEREWAFSRGHATQILDNLIADKKAVPMIVVMTSNEATTDGTKRHVGAEARVAFGNFEKELFQAVIPYVEKNYSTYTDKDHRALAGWSLGGGQTLQFGLNHLDKFAYLAALSAATNADDIAKLTTNKDEVNKLKLFWLSVGNQDGLYPINHQRHETLTQEGINHYWHMEPGAHVWSVPRACLYQVAQLLFKK